MKKIFLLIFIINSCTYPALDKDELIYDNDFEDQSLENISGGVISEFVDSNVIGNYNNDGFNLHLNNVGDHDYIFVSFDLYVHGSWDGNKNGFEENDTADFWTIEINPGMDLHNDSSNNKFITTFSNSPCLSNYCLRQSFPNSFPFSNNPKKGADKIDLDAFCQNNFFGGKTTLYKIEKTFKSAGNAIVISFYDNLYQPNAIDQFGENQQKCDESWSLDNLKIRVISYD